MRNLLLVESLDLCPSNQYVLVRVIPTCFRFAKMCLCQEFPVKVQPEILILFLGELRVDYMDWWARFSSYGESAMDRLRSIGVHSPFF
jgi:hypothetical protein